MAAEVLTVDDVVYWRCVECRLQSANMYENDPGKASLMENQVKNHNLQKHPGPGVWIHEKVQSSGWRVMAYDPYNMPNVIQLCVTNNEDDARYIAESCRKNHYWRWE